MPLLDKKAGGHQRERAMSPALTIAPEPPADPKPRGAWARVGHRVLRERSTYLVLGLVIMALDAVIRPVLAFPILFVVPVSMSAWYCRRAGAMLLAIGLPLARLLPPHVSGEWTALTVNLPNALIRIAVLMWIAYFVRRTSVQAEALRQEVRVLQGILPTCLGCRRIRTETNQWQQMESYIAERSGAEFSHSYCPECEQKALAALKGEMK